MNNKKKGVLFLWISLVIIITSLMIFIIGCHSSYLINDMVRRFSLTILILAILFMIYSSYLIIRFKYRRCYKNLKIIIISIIIGLYIIGCSTALILFYGPSDKFRVWYITSGMRTLHHQYLCYWFYNNDEINEVLSENFIDDGDAETDVTLIDHKKKVTYENEYERQILEREEDALYKIIRFKVNGCNAYLGVVYDPSKIRVGVTKRLGVSGQYIYDMAKEQNAVLAINGGGFYDPGYNGNGSTPLGITIADGKIVTDYTLQNTGLIGFDIENNLVLKKKINANDAISMGIRDAVTMSPFLIVNGQPSFMRGNGGWGYAARSAIGQRKDGIVLLLVVDSNEFRTNGASMIDLTEIMQRYGAINAANLDGGTSSAMVENGKLISDPIDSTLAHRTRGIPTIFKVVDE